MKLAETTNPIWRAHAARGVGEEVTRRDGVGASRSVLKWPNLQLATRLVFLGEVSLLDRGFPSPDGHFLLSALATLVLRATAAGLEGVANVLQNVVDIVGLRILSRTNHVDRVHLNEGVFSKPPPEDLLSLLSRSGLLPFATDKRRSSSEFDSKNRMAGWPVLRYFCRRWPAWPAPMFLGKNLRRSEFARFVSWWGGPINVCDHVHYNAD